MSSVAAEQRHKCAYCSHHNLDACSLFDDKPSHICYCCGTNMAKEREKQLEAAEAVKRKGNDWGGTMPYNIQMGDYDDDEEGGSNSKSVFLSDRISHKPSVCEEWLPKWFVSLAHDQGFCFNDLHTEASLLSSQQQLSALTITAAGVARERGGEGGEKEQRAQKVRAVSDSGVVTTSDIPSVSVRVCRLWKRVMPKSSCWQIRIPVL
jgi:hypothetical protein